MNVPKLRFPEFRDAGEWEERKAGALFANRVDVGEEGLPIYSVTMNNGMVKRSSLERRVDDITESSGNKKVLKGDITYNMMRMWQGAFGVAPEDCMVSPAYVVLSPENEAYSDFLGYLFKLPKYLQLLTSHSQGLTLDRLRLYYKDFARISILIPSIPEQQKIASCLSSIDDLITTQAQKLEALKTHKKGLMQQLFPREGETVPLLRFPEFRDAGDWVKKALDKICSSISSGKDKGDSNGKYDLYGSTGVIGKTSNDTYDGSFILAARVGANAGLLTKASGKFGVTDNTLVIILKSSENIDFIFYSLEKFGLNKMVFGSGQPLITGGQLKEVGIILPSPEEQKKVTDCLSSIDDLITTQTEKLKALKTHKKGLMQQLFPAAHEVGE